MFGNIWYFWTLHIKVRIQKIHVASTRNSGSSLLGPKLNFLIFIFPNVHPELSTFDQNFERSTGMSKVRQEFRTSDRHSERPTEISNVRPKFRTSSQDFELPTNISNVQPVCRTSSHYFERPASILKVQPIFRTSSPFFLDSMNFRTSSVTAQEKNC